MLKKMLPFIFTALFAASCTSIPDPIDDRYLSDAGNDDQEKIKNIEMMIMDKRAEKNISEEKLKIILPKPGLLEEEIKLLERDIRIKKDQLRFYLKSKEENVARYKTDELNKTEDMLKFKKKLLNLRKLEKQYAEAELNLKNAELAVYVSELNYEKSKIAAAYRDKTEPPKGDGEKQGFVDKYIKRKDPSDRYDYRKYEKFHEERKEDLGKAKTELSIAEKSYFKELKRFNQN